MSDINFYFFSKRKFQFSFFLDSPYFIHVKYRRNFSVFIFEACLILRNRSCFRMFYFAVFFSLVSLLSVFSTVSDKISLSVVHAYVHCCQFFFYFVKSTLITLRFALLRTITIYGTIFRFCPREKR